MEKMITIHLILPMIFSRDPKRRNIAPGHKSGAIDPGHNKSTPTSVYSLLGHLVQVCRRLGSLLAARAETRPNNFRLDWTSS